MQRRRASYGLSCLAPLATPPPILHCLVLMSTPLPSCPIVAGCKQRRRRIKELKAALALAATAGAAVPAVHRSAVISTQPCHHASPFQMPPDQPATHSSAAPSPPASYQSYQCSPLAPQHSFPPSSALHHLHHQLSGTPPALLGSSGSAGPPDSLDGYSANLDRPGYGSLPVAPATPTYPPPQAMTPIIMLPAGAQLPPGAQLVILSPPPQLPQPAPASAFAATAMAAAGRMASASPAGMQAPGQAGAPATPPLLSSSMAAAFDSINLEAFGEF